MSQMIQPIDLRVLNTPHRLSQEDVDRNFSKFIYWHTPITKANGILGYKRKKPRYYYRWNYSCSPIRKCPSEVYFSSIQIPMVYTTALWANPFFVLYNLYLNACMTHLNKRIYPIAEADGLSPKITRNFMKLLSNILAYSTNPRTGMSLHQTYPIPSPNCSVGRSRPCPSRWG